MSRVFNIDVQDDSDDENNQRQMIAEAFAEDDVVADFQKEKEQLVKEKICF